MITTFTRTVRATMLGLGLMAAAAGRADAGMILSVEAAGVQASKVAGVTTESFDSYPTGVFAVTGQASPIGTFTSPGIAVVAADQYGGAGGTGKYFAIGSQSGTTSATLTFNGAQSYFGFWWSAADRLNGVDFYSAGKLLGSLSAATVLANLGSAYNGNPTTGVNTNEKYAYLNFTGTNGTTIDQVVFRNSSLGSGFEADNFSVRAAATAISGTAINGGFVSAVPEPSSLALVGVAGLLGAGAWSRARRRGAADPA